MRKELLAAVLALVALTPSAEAFAVGTGAGGRRAQRATQMRMGYADGNQALALGLDAPVTVRCAIEFPESALQRLKGSRITALRFALGCTPSTQDNYVFVSADLNSAPVYKQAVARLSGGWNEVKLDTPFEITGAPLYVGFRYNSSGNALSMDGRDDNALANWLSLTQSGDEASSEWVHQSGGNINLEAVVEGDGLPQNDARLEKLVAKRYAGTNADTPAALIVRNAAAADINSIEVTYTIEDQGTYTQTIDNLDIATNAVAVVPVHGIVFKHNGVANLDMTITKVNGEADENTADNSATEENIVSKKDYANRKVLLEHFSTANCNNCPEAHKLIEDALIYRSDVVHVVHHAGMGTDFLSIPEHDSYLCFFGTGNVYNPAAMLDRTNMSPYGATDGVSGSTSGPAFFPRRATFGSILDQSLSSPALVTVDISRNYDAATRKLQVAVSGNVPAGTPSRLKASDLRLNIFVVEDSIYGKQLGAPDTQHYCHNGSVRKVLTGVWGDAVAFSGADYQTDAYTFDIPEGWNPGQMHVVAFLANYNKADVNDCQVLNANSVDVTPKAETAIGNTIADGNSVKVAVADGRLVIFGSYRTADVFDITGRRVAHVSGNTSSMPLAGMGAGVLIVRVNTAAGVETFKLVSRN